MDHYHAPFTHESIFVQRLGNQEGYRSWALNQKVRDGVEHRAFEHGHSVMDHPNWTRRHREPPSEYMAALQTGRGRERAAQVMEGDIHIYVFPNLLFQESSQSYRVIRPVAVDRTEVFDYPYRLKGAPESYNDERVRGVSRWASATGTGQPDDLEAFSRVQEGLRAVGPEWVIFARGSGPGEIRLPGRTDFRQGHRRDSDARPISLLEALDGASRLGTGEFPKESGQW